MFAQTIAQGAWRRVRRLARRVLHGRGFVEARVEPFDFLHPATPPAWLDRVTRLGLTLERTPLLREIAGSILLTASKP